jgi:hypothetical protein
MLLTKPGRCHLREEASDWESHCLELAVVFSRHGCFDKALVKTEETLEPPYPLPAFAERQCLTVDDVRRHVSAFGAEGGSHGMAEAGQPSDCEPIA